MPLVAKVLVQRVEAAASDRQSPRVQFVEPWDMVPTIEREQQQERRDQRQIVQGVGAWLFSLGEMGQAGMPRMPAASFGVATLAPSASTMVTARSTSAAFPGASTPRER